MKRLRKVVLIVFIGSIISVIGYAESDSETITIRMRVLPVSTIEVSQDIVDIETSGGNSHWNNSPNMLVRTTVVDGQTYRELTPLPEE